jgi:hypothetical protein
VSGMSSESESETSLSLWSLTVEDSMWLPASEEPSGSELVPLLDDSCVLLFEEVASVDLRDCIRFFALRPLDVLPFFFSRLIIHSLTVASTSLFSSSVIE